MDRGERQRTAARSPQSSEALIGTKVVVTGASGLIGGAVSQALLEQGAEVTRLSRADRGPGWAQWDPDRGQLDAAPLEGADLVVHLAGEGIGAARWTERRKRALTESRVRSTELLSTTLARLKHRPRLLISASGIHYYGDTGDAVVDEQSPPGETFLARLCQAWEQATEPAAGAGIRVVTLRMGMVLAGQGGALDRMLPAFRAGVGGRLGSGRQYMPWIALDDVLEIVRFAHRHPELSGPVNAVAPQAVDNATFTRSLAKALRRPALIPVPGVALRLAFGEMGEVLLLSSVRASPVALHRAGFRFRYPTLEAALAHVLQGGTSRQLP